MTSPEEETKERSSRLARLPFENRLRKSSVGPFDPKIIRANGQLPLACSRALLLTRKPQNHAPKSKEPRTRKQSKPEYGPPANCPSMGFCPLRRFQTKAATYTEVTSLGFAAPSGFLNLLTLCSALALSALSHAESVLGVVTLRGFPLPVAATAFTARCPRTRLAPRRQRELREPKYAPSTPPPRHRVAPGFMHLGGPFSTGRCYPGPVGRAPHSLLAPSRISPLEPWPRVCCAGPPLMGLSYSAGRIHRCKDSLQSVKELEDRLASFECRHPP